MEEIQDKLSSCSETDIIGKELMKPTEESSPISNASTNSSNGVVDQSEAPKVTNFESLLEEEENTSFDL